MIRNVDREFRVLQEGEKEIIIFEFAYPEDFQALTLFNKLSQKTAAEKQENNYGAIKEQAFKALVKFIIATVSDGQPQNRIFIKLGINNINVLNHIGTLLHSTFSNTYFDLANALLKYIEDQDSLNYGINWDRVIDNIGKYPIDEVYKNLTD